VITTDNQIIGDTELIKAYRTNKLEGYELKLLIIDRITFTKKVLDDVNENGEKKVLIYQNYHIKNGEKEDVIPIASPLESYVRDILNVPNPEPIDGISIKAFYLDGKLKGFTGLDE